MANKTTTPAAGARIGSELGKRKRAELLARLGPHLGRVEVVLMARGYLMAVLSNLKSLNGWSIAEFLGKKSPDSTQRFLNPKLRDLADANTRSDLGKRQVRQVGVLATRHYPARRLAVRS